jgi:hypothetical protein
MKKIKHKLLKETRVYKLVFFIGVYLVLANKIEAQTEQNQQTIDTNNLVLLNDYNVDTIKTYETALIDMNRKMELDSFTLGQVYEVTYQFINIESKPIKMKDVIGSCSCMTYEWYNQPIDAGATGWIKIKYKATIPEKIFSNIKLILYDINGIKPMVIIPVKISANAKYPNAN